MSDQQVVFGVFAAVLVLFIWGRWRYDLVALLALLALTITGIVPADTAFLGIGHPAVITVAAVLVVSRGLENARVIDLVAQAMGRVGEGRANQIGAVTALVALLSGFINNVGALALLMPVAIRMARERDTSPALLLMPLAFGSLLGGMITLIGTPANLIVAAFRAEERGIPFQMFDFLPVGAGIAIVGVVFIVVSGSRLIPLRTQGATEASFHIEDYLTEVRIPSGSRLVGQSLRELGEVAAGAVVVGLVREQSMLAAPSSFETLREGDVLVVEADTRTLQRLVDEVELELVGREGLHDEVLQSDEVRLIEVVVRPRAILEGETARSLDLRWQYGLNLLAVSRHGERLRERLDRIHFQAGDVLLLQGRVETAHPALVRLGALPLAERAWRWGKRRIVLALAIFGGGVLAAALDILPVQVALVMTAVAMVLMGLLSLGEAYKSIDWSILVLLGAVTPIGHQSNTLVMGPGGYRFGDYWRLGLPLSVLVVLVGTPLIAWFWPFE